MGTAGVSQYSAKKPNYEVGAAMPLKLKFAPKQQAPVVAPVSNAAEVWALSANDVLDDDDGDDVSLQDEMEALQNERMSGAW